MSSHEEEVESERRDVTPKRKVTIPCIIIIVSGVFFWGGLFGQQWLLNRRFTSVKYGDGKQTVLEKMGEPRETRRDATPPSFTMLSGGDFRPPDVADDLDTWKRGTPETLIYSPWIGFLFDFRLEVTLHNDRVVRKYAESW